MQTSLQENEERPCIVMSQRIERWFTSCLYVRSSCLPTADGVWATCCYKDTKLAKLWRIKTTTKEFLERVFTKRRTFVRNQKQRWVSSVYVLLALEKDNYYLGLCRIRFSSESERESQKKQQTTTLCNPKSWLRMELLNSVNIIRTSPSTKLQIFWKLV